MRFKKPQYIDESSYYDALCFLIDAFEQNKINEIENFEDILEALDGANARISKLEDELSHWAPPGYNF